MSSDHRQNLSERVAARDATAFDELHDLYSPRLRAMFAKRVRGSARDVIEDLVQQTWAALWRSVSGGRYDPSRAAISTFVYAIGNKIWLQHCQRTGRVPSPEPEEDWTERPEDSLAAAELIEALNTCVETPGLLDPEEREIVQAVAHGESERALAVRLGLAASTINARKHSAYKKLRRCLGGKGFDAEMIEQLGGSLE